MCRFALIALAFTFWANFSHAMNFSISERAGIQWVECGPDYIVDGDLKRFLNFSKQINRKLPTVFMISSFGGSFSEMPNLDEAYLLSNAIQDVANEIEANKQAVWGYVPFFCASACIPLFAQFKNRAMSSFRFTRIGFHSPSKNKVPNRALRNEYVLFLANSGGFNVDWLKHYYSIFETKKVTELSAKQLLESNSGLITSEENILEVPGLFERIKPILPGEQRKYPSTIHGRYCKVGIDNGYGLKIKLEKSFNRIDGTIPLRKGTELNETVKKDEVILNGTVTEVTTFEVLYAPKGSKPSGFAQVGDTVIIDSEHCAFVPAQK